MKIIKEPIIVKESIGKILIESLILSVITLVIITLIIKLLSTEMMISIMWQLVDCPECIIMPFLPVLFSIMIFTKFIITFIKEEK